MSSYVWRSASSSFSASRTKLSWRLKLSAAASVPAPPSEGALPGDGEREGPSVSAAGRLALLPLGAFFFLTGT